MLKTLRILFLVIKGVLLMIALTALLMWPASRGRAMEALAERHTMASESFERRWCWCAAWDGRVYLGWGWGRYFNPQLLDRLREDPKASAGGWQFERSSQELAWNELRLSRWGALRWEISDTNNVMIHQLYRRFAAPLWLVALVAGTWPAASLALAVRRRITRRRAGREGLCPKCGYDLRATPNRCPECGTIRRL
jgi:hypothetical protein